MINDDDEMGKWHRENPGKSKIELEKIAREIWDLMSGCDNKSQALKLMTEALARVQDEALRNMLPSYESIIEDAKKMDDENSGPVHGAMRAYYFIRDNMKPAPTSKDTNDFTLSNHVHAGDTTLTEALSAQELGAAARKWLEQNPSPTSLTVREWLNAVGKGEK